MAAARTCWSAVGLVGRCGGGGSGGERRERRGSQRTVSLAKTHVCFPLVGGTSCRRAGGTGSNLVSVRRVRAIAHRVDAQRRARHAPSQPPVTGGGRLRRPARATVKASGCAPIVVRTVTFVHRCPFCGWERPAETETILEPGLRLLRRRAARGERGRHRARPPRGHRRARPARTRGDGTAVLALLVTSPWALPLLGVRLGDVAFLVPLVLHRLRRHRGCRPATVTEPSHAPVWRIAGARRRPRRRRPPALMVAAAVVTGDVGRAGFYLGAARSVLLVLAAATATPGAPRATRRPRACSTPRSLALICGGLGIWLLVVRSAAGGDAVLSGIVVLDIVAAMLFALGAAASGTPRARTGRVVARLRHASALDVGDGLVAGAAVGHAPRPACAHRRPVGASPASPSPPRPISGSRRSAASRPRPSTIGLAVDRAAASRCPLCAVLGLPRRRGRAAASPASSRRRRRVYFGALTLAALLLAFSRQAYLLRRAPARGRARARAAARSRPAATRSSRRSPAWRRR